MISVKRLFAAALAALMLAAIAVPALAAETDEAETTAVNAAADAVLAEDVTASAEFSAGGWYSWGDLTDKNDATHVAFGVDHVWITAKKPVAGVYLKFYEKNSAWQITVGDKIIECGQKDFLHEFAALPEGSRGTELRLTFPRGADVSELALYTEGALPDDVQVWEDALDGGADLLMLATRAGDEHTVLGGVLPTAIADGARCQVVYFCDLSGDPIRMHEALDGLWAIGDRYYPVAGVFPDVEAESREDAEAAYAARGYGVADLVEWNVGNIRRFRPQVLVIHDEKGEGDALSALNSEAAREATAAASDRSAYPMSLASTGGEWDTPKTYMHLCEKGAITLGLDEPLDFYGGLTAYEVSKAGFEAHKSQHYSERYAWLTGAAQGEGANDNAPRYSSAAEIETYSPAKWGLWRTTVGEDTGADMFENVARYMRPGDETREAATETEPATETEAATTQTVAPVTEEAQETDGTPERDRLMKIVAICAASVVIGTALALILSGTRSRRDAREMKRMDENRRARAEENAKRVREARDERAKLDGEENAAAVRRVIEAQSTRHDPSGKGAEREASIRAARASRESGGADHDKPTDKRY